MSWFSDRISDIGGIVADVVTAPIKIVAAPVATVVDIAKGKNVVDSLKKNAGVAAANVIKSNPLSAVAASDAGQKFTKQLSPYTLGLSEGYDFQAQLARAGEGKQADIIGGAVKSAKAAAIVYGGSLGVSAVGGTAGAIGGASLTSRFLNDPLGTLKNEVLSNSFFDPVRDFLPDFGGSDSSGGYLPSPVEYYGDSVSPRSQSSSSNLGLIIGASVLLVGGAIYLARRR